MLRTLLLAFLFTALATPVLRAETAPQRRHSNSLALTAKALGCDVKTVQAVKALNLSCSLSWVLMRLCASGGADPSQIMAERATRSWGEVCALHGQNWADLVNDVLRREKAFGLVVEGGPQIQNTRSASNHPDQMKFSKRAQ